MSFFEHELYASRGFLQKVDQSRIPLMDWLRVDDGWVVDARRGDPLWEHMAEGVVPISPKKPTFGFQSQEAREAQVQLNEWRAKLGDPDAFMLLTEYPGVNHGWLGRLVRPSDLVRNDSWDLSYEREAAEKAGNQILFDALDIAIHVYTSPEKIKHRAYLAKHNGRRISQMDAANVSNDWVVDDLQDNKAWKFMYSNVIPLRPKNRKAYNELRVFRAELNDPGAFVVMVPNIMTDTTWMVRPIRLTDLERGRKNQEILLKDAEAAWNDHNAFLSDALEASYRAVSGAYTELNIIRM